ncbi:uncharacterized protein BDR25DRAFT_261554 [Lindgomyces ingoldianus]|uniref:Uncharacterized protein n=1 Tax=Lindgomyces ingoldianus TaxID=673940 RepID=A0ACB6QWB0_9PLEO|nr:uncharacterized protein BDR25DRAFT_261554 [Lindgomyces ingoldianus]KAF2471122.1 hypothetical protein BDR25DRAFT_261554 [Lindgomyces ingoldianus]
MSGDILVYLLSRNPPTFAVSSLERETTTILVGCSRSKGEDVEYLQRFANILNGLKKGAMFEALHAKLQFKWEKVYDTTNPFGDFRQVMYQTAWTFDIEHDVLLCANRSGVRRTPLRVLRQRTATLDDLKPLSPPSSPMPTLRALPTTFWKPEVQVSEKTRTFTHRLLRDFSHQWRHILRRSWNDTTSRVLARGVIRLSSLDFEVREVTKERGGGLRGHFVWVTMLPEWEPFTTNIALVGGVHLVVCQTVQEGLSTAQNHAASQALKTGKMAKSRPAKPDYIVLSMKYIMLCRLGGSAGLEHTRPEPLFNGTTSPPDLALDYLVWATTNPSVTRLHLIPTEVQDVILSHLSVGPVEPARVGCLLGIGSEFTWRDGQASIALEETHTARTPWTPIDSQIWFGPHMSGIVYRGQVSLAPTIGVNLLHSH